MLTKVRGQGGIIILTQEGSTVTKEKVVPTFIHMIKETEILELLDGYMSTITDIAKVIHKTNDKGLVSFKKQIIYYGPPGTGKTHKAFKLALMMLDPD